MYISQKLIDLYVPKINSTPLKFLTLVTEIRFKVTLNEWPKICHFHTGINLRQLSTIREYGVVMHLVASDCVCLSCSGSNF